MTITIPQFQAHHYLRLALESAGLGVSEASEKLDVSRETVSRWLNGRVAPSTPVLMAWAQMTGVDYDWLRAMCARRDSNPQPSDP